MVASLMRSLLLTVLPSLLMGASAFADAPSAIPDSASRAPYLLSPAEVEFAAPRHELPHPLPWPDATWWTDAGPAPPEGGLRPPTAAGRDSLLVALLLARCGREGDPAAAWRLDPSLHWRLRLARLEASWLPPGVRRLLLGQARAGEYRRLKSREAELYDEFLATEIPVTEITTTGE
jgi:hypothetical protein